MSDSELAAIMGEPPRKRRAAALAAQKNWQMLSVPEDGDGDDDLIVTEHIIRQPVNVKKVPQNSNAIIITTPSVPKRTSLPNNFVINLNASTSGMTPGRGKRTPAAVDRDFFPNPEIVPQSLKARKSFPTPQVRPHIRPQRTTPIPMNKMTVRPMVTNVMVPVNHRVPIIQTIAQSVPKAPMTRTRAQDSVLIETETSKRVISRTDASYRFRKPNVFKLVPTEPDVFPKVDGEDEVIIGNYLDDLFIDDNKEDDDVVEELSLVLFCESENKKSKQLEDSKDKSEDEIQVIDVKEVPKTYTKTPLRTVQKKNLTRGSRPTKGHLDTIIDTLEMECENFDDEFTDGLLFDCEDDILSETQWKQAVDKKKEYNEYSKTVLSTKLSNVKFLPEAEVTDPVGIVVKTLSETTKIISKPIQSPQITVIGPRNRQNFKSIQSIRGPIPSLVNQSNPIRHPGIVRPQMSSNNRMPITLLPVSNQSGAPMIIAPSNFMNTTAMGSGLRVILAQPPLGGQPTYVMVPRSSASNGLPQQNLLISNGNVYQPNVITTTSNQIINVQNTYRPRSSSSAAPIVFRAPGPAPSVPRNPIVTFSGANKRFSVQSNQTTITQNSVSNPLFECLTVFKTTGTPTKKITMRTVLTIKPLPFSWPSKIDDLINSLIKLDNALMKEKFKESPISWMVSAKLITPPKCKNCFKGVCNRVNRTLNAKNEFWYCNNPLCSRSYPIERPKIFEAANFDVPVSKLLFLIYYWSIQVDVEDLIKTGQIEMGSEKIFNVWNRLQKVCTYALNTKDQQLGPSVEICSIQVGRFHVLGAMDVKTHRTKLTVVPITEIIQRNGKQTVMAPFIRFIRKGSIIRTCEPKFQSLSEYGFKIHIQSKNAFLAANKNSGLNSISGYLIHHLQRFFKDIDLNTLTADILSNILDELVWRERFGTNPFLAFYNIVRHIGEQCAIKTPDYDQTVIQIGPTTTPALSVGTPTSTPNVGKRTGAPVGQKQVQAVTFRRPPPLLPVLNESNSVFVDEYFYSSLQLKTTTDSSQSQEETLKDSIQCHLCQMFFDNILIVKHLLEHFEKERGGRQRKGDNNESECKHCLRFFSNRSLHLHEEMANQKLVPFSCRICLIPLLARQPFIGHMKTTHFSGEMPFYCDICNYRSSFQKNLFDHFEATHSNSSQVMCPYCIRIFQVSKFKNLSSFLYRHLTTHYAVASVYDCSNCVLTFTTKADLKEHCFKGHNPSNAVDEKFDVTPYVVADEDKSLCTRAKEDELFTPFLPNLGQMSNSLPESDPNNVELSCEISCEPNIGDFLVMEPEIQINMMDTETCAANFIIPVDCDYTNDQLKQMLIKSFDTNQSEEETDEQIEGVEPESDPKTESTTASDFGSKPESEADPDSNSKSESAAEPASGEKSESTSESGSGPEPEPVVESDSDPKPEPVAETKKDYILFNNKKVICFECKTEWTTDHFNSRMNCIDCNFTTHCKTIFDEHTNEAHTQPQHNKQSSIMKCFPQSLSYQISCKDCDFNSNDGNKFALHMIESNHLDIICKQLEPKPTSL